MKNHYTLTDLEFEVQFASASLDPDLFTHEAHLRLAWIHIYRYGVDTAIRNICSQLKNFTITVGAASKYNETVTVAAIRAVYHFMKRSVCADFRSFVEENYRLKTNFKDLMNAHYRTDIFKSEHAKRSYLEPELLPFD
jgi:hypothetical protein